MRAADHRNRAAPVALAADAPVAQAVVDPARAAAVALEALGQCIQRLAEIHAVVFTGVHQHAARRPRRLLADASLERLHHAQRCGDVLRVAVVTAQRGLHAIDADAERQVVANFPQRLKHRRIDDHHLDRQTVFLRKLPVALVVRRHRHHRAGAVAHQHEVGHPHRDRLAAERMDRAQAGVHAALFLGFEFSLGDAAAPEIGDEVGQLRVVLRGMQRQRMLGGDRQEGHPHQRVRPGGEHAQRLGCALDREVDLQPFAAADPVALHGLDRVGPARQRVQALQQLLRVVGDLDEPLRDLALLHQRAGAPAAAVDHLLVGQHGLVDRIPVHHRVLAVGQALLHQPHEHPLFMHVIVRTAGGELARPVDRVAERLQLAAHVLDVGVGPLGRRGLVLDRGVLGRQAERIPAHRLQHVLALHALVAADHVADGVVAHVAHVQGAGRVRQHREAVELRLGRVLVHLVGALCVPVLLRGGFHRLRLIALAGVAAGLGGVGVLNVLHDSGAVLR